MKKIKAKEPVRIRFKKLAHGNRSIYLDCYLDGKRTYEFLKLYLVPETDAQSRAANRMTMTAANAIKSRRTLDIIEGRLGRRTPHSSPLLLSEWMDRLCAAAGDRGLSPATVKNYRSLLRPILNYTEGVCPKLCDIDAAFCSRFMQYLVSSYHTPAGNRLLPGSVQVYGTRLRALLSHAVREQLLPENPFPLQSPGYNPRKTPAHREFLTIEEIKQLIQTPCTNMSVKQAFLFACFCGLRLSDIETLEWHDFRGTADAPVIEKRIKKTGEMLYLPLSKSAGRWLPDKTSSLVFADLPCRSTLLFTLKRWTAAAGLEKNVSFHTSRHTFATMMLTLGADIYTTSKLLGHSSVNVTQIYARIINRKKRDAVLLADSIF